MIQMLIDVTFLGLMLTPVFILFVALYQNLLETQKPKQKIEQERISTQFYYTEPDEALPSRLRAVK